MDSRNIQHGRELNVLRRGAAKKDEMFKPILMIVAAALAAGVVASATSAAPRAQIATSTQRPPQSFAKANRPPVASKGAACSQNGWPNYEGKCQFDVREPDATARTVRVVAFR